MENIKAPLTLLMILSIYGCATTNTPKQYVIEFDSVPQGASLICGSKNFGYTPVQLYFDESIKENPSLDLTHCTANWASGAKVDYGVAPIANFPDGMRAIEERPAGPGYAQDAEFALKVKNMQAQQRQANAAQSQANSAQSQANTAIYNQYKVERPKTCVTNFNITTCF